jgi:pimeloyl-ACP methyl ester carboxylesterase
MFCWYSAAVAIATSLPVVLGRGCPPGYIDLAVTETGNGSTLHFAWKPPAGFPTGTNYEILSSEHSPTSSNYCEFKVVNGADEHVIATTTDTTFDYEVPDNQLVQFGVRVAGCPNLTSPFNAADTFPPPRAPTVIDVQSPPGSGRVTFTFSESDVHAAEVDLARIDPAGEAPDSFPITVQPAFTYSAGTSTPGGYCPPGSQVVVTDGLTSATPERLAPGAYLYQLVAINEGLGHPGDSFGASEPICVKIDCPACSCESTLTPVDANCENDADVECNRGLPTDLSKLFSSPRRFYITADGAAELVLFQAESTDAEITFTMNTFPGNAQAGSAYGTLLTLDGSSSGTSIRVRPQLTIGKLRYAFVRYRAPADLPSSDHRLYILASIPSRKPLPPGQWYYRPLSSMNIGFVPPPVVLVHGVWSGPQVWTGLQDYLRKSGRDVWIVDYGDGVSAHPNNAPSFDPALSGSAPVMDALDRAVDGAREEYRLSGFAIARVDAVGHSMGGLVLRGRTVYAYRGYERGENGFHGDFHKLITIGTPHNGSPLADWLIAHKCDRLHLPLSNPTIEEQLTTMRRPLGPGIYQLQTGSAALRRLGEAAVPSHSIVGIAPNAITDLEDTLNQLSFLSGNGLGVEGIMSAAGVHAHDVIVPAESQSGGLASTEIHNVVHTRANTGAPDVAETESTAVWAAVNDALQASVHDPMFGRFGQPPLSGATALDNEPCPTTTLPPPADDPTALSVVPGTVVHPGTSISVSFSPTAGFDGCFLTIGDSTFVRHGLCSATWTVPNTTGGRIEVTAATFGGQTDSHATSYVMVQESSPPSVLRMAPIFPLTLSAIGASAQLTVTAASGNASLLDVTSSTAGTSYSTMRGSSVVSVSKDGRVTAVAEGKDIVTASHAGLTNSIQVTVRVTNHPPVLAAVDTKYLLTPGTTASINLSATDADRNSIAYSVMNLPRFGTLIDHGDGSASVRLQPASTDVGEYDITVIVQDNGVPPLGTAASIRIEIASKEGNGSKRRAVNH